MELWWSLPDETITWNDLVLTFHYLPGSTPPTQRWVDKPMNGRLTFYYVSVNLPAFTLFLECHSAFDIPRNQKIWHLEILHTGSIPPLYLKLYSVMTFWLRYSIIYIQPNQVDEKTSPKTDAIIGNWFQWTEVDERISLRLLTNSRDLIKIKFFCSTFFSSDQALNTQIIGTGKRGWLRHFSVKL